MGSLKEFIEQITEQIEIDKESDDFKSLMENVPEQELPEGFEDKFHNSFLTLEAAKNHGDINSHYRGKHLSGIDNALEQALKDMELPDEYMEEIAGTKATLDKVKVAIAKINENKKALIEELEKKSKSGKKDDKSDEKIKELTDEITKLQGQLTKTQDEYEQKLQEKDSAFERERWSAKVNDIISNYKLATNDVLTADKAKYLIRKEIDDLPYDFKKDEEGNYTPFKKGTDVKAMENNKVLTMEGVIEKVVTPYVQKSDPAKPEKKALEPSANGSGKNSYVFGQHAKQ